MKQRDLDKIKEIIVSTGVGTFTQRVAICTRLQDWFDETKRRASDAKPSV